MVMAIIGVSKKGERKESSLVRNHVEDQLSSKERLLLKATSSFYGSENVLICPIGLNSMEAVSLAFFAPFVVHPLSLSLFSTYSPKAK